MFVLIFLVSGVNVIKQGMVTLREKETINLWFGQSHDVLVAQEKKPLRYYSLQDCNKLTLLWEKTLPEGLKCSCWMYTTPSNKLVMSWSGVMFVFDRNLNLQRKHKVPGEIRAVMGDDYFLVDNYYTDASKKSGVLRVSRRELSAPEKENFTLSTPADGAYKRDDVLYAACAEDGHTAIMAEEKSYVDFYTPTGQCIL